MKSVPRVLYLRMSEKKMNENVKTSITGGIACLVAYKAVRESMRFIASNATTGGHVLGCNSFLKPGVLYTLEPEILYLAYLALEVTSPAIVGLNAFLASPNLP